MTAVQPKTHLPEDVLEHAPIDDPVMLAIGGNLQQVWGGVLGGQSCRQHVSRCWPDNIGSSDRSMLQVAASWLQQMQAIQCSETAASGADARLSTCT